MRPLLHPALPRLWRAAGIVQLGLEAASSVVLALDQVALTLLLALDGSRSINDLRRLATQLGTDPTAADRLVDVLQSSGALLDANRPAALPERLRPDAAALMLLRKPANPGEDILRRRRDSFVEIRGAGRVGASVAVLLAAAGVGTVFVDDSQATRPGDLSPLGPAASDVGRQRAAAVHAVIQALAVGTAVTARPRSADVVVLTPVSGLARAEAADLIRTGVPHILARATETSGSVGPFVLPGRSSCLRCHDLHRTDRDPAWPRLVLQVDNATAAEPSGSIVQAVLVAAAAASEVLAFVDGFSPATVDATLEVVLPSPVFRRRTWSPHPACGCRWDVQVAADHAHDREQPVRMGG